MTEQNSSMKSHIDAIRALPGQIRAAVAGLDDAQLDTPYRDGGWTVRQVVHHLADSHINGYTRMRLILTEHHPTLKPYDQDSWAVLADSRMPLDSSLAILDGLHNRWATMLDSVQGDEAWHRTAYHPEDGELSLASIVPVYSNHGRNHVAQITGLRERMGW